MEKAILLLKQFKKLGFAAYIVGGSVRDYLLGKDSFDIDISTDATPEEVMANFKSTPIGLKYGTVLVFFEGEKYEVTTFRKDLKYYDNRHPKGVIFTKNIEEDAHRRDFTINGMYLDENYNVIDMVGGRKDLDKKIIKTVGNPDERFKEDALRMLRAFYLVSKLGFEIEDETYNAIKKNVKLIEKVSAERIFREIEKISTHQHYHKALQLLVKSEIYLYLPGLSKGLVSLAVAKGALQGDSFIAACFYFNDGKIDNFWKISNNKKRLYKNVISILKSNNPFTSHFIYNFTKEEILVAAQIYKVFGKHLTDALNPDKKIIEIYNSLPIKNEKELAISNEKIISIVNKKPGYWLTELKDDIVKKILSCELNNNIEEISKYILKRKDKYGKKE